MRPWRRLVPIAVAVAVAVSAAASLTPGVASAALHATQPVDLGRGAIDLRGSDDGSVRAAIALPPRMRGGRERTAITVFRRDGRSRRVRTVGTAIPASRRRQGGSTILEGAGLLSAARARSGNRIAILADDGRHAPRISGELAKTSEPVAFSGGGASGVLFQNQTGADQRQDYIALRPPGSNRYRSPIAIDAPYGVGLVEYSVAFGAGGDGAIVAQPRFADEPGVPVRVRRIDRAGRLGPWIPVGGAVDLGLASVAVAADGAVAIAMIESPGLDPTSTGVSPPGPASLVTAALLPGALAATPVQTWLDVGDIAQALLYEDLAVAFGEGEQVVVATGAEHPVPPSTSADHPGVVDVLTGRAGTLTQRAALPALEPASTRAVITDDGGVTVVWAAENRDGRNAIVGSRAEPGGPMSSPGTLVTTRFPPTRHDGSGTVTPQALVPTGGRESALSYFDASDASGGVEARLVRLRP